MAPTRGKATQPKPCGPQDRRLIVRRCQNCRRQRKGCDGGRPCNRCRSRSIECCGLEGLPTRTAIFLNHNTTLLPVSGAIPPEVADAFSSFVGGPSSPFDEVFSLSALSEDIKSFPSIRAIITAIGNVMVKQAAFPDRQGQAIAASSEASLWRPELQHHLTTMVAQAPKERQTLVFGLLYAILEIAVDASGLRFITAMNEVARAISTQDLETPPHKHHLGALFSVYRVLEAMRALILDEDTFLSDIEHEPMPVTAETSLPDMDRAFFYDFADLLVSFTHVSAKSTAWARKAHDVVHCKANDATSADSAPRARLVKADLISEGTSIIQKSGDLLALALSRLGNAPAKNAAHFSSLRIAYHHCSIVGIARLFSDPIWLLVGEKLPAADQIPHLESHAQAALHVLEQRVHFVGLEALTYVQFIVALFLEVKTAEDQQRVMTLYENIARKGFVIADTYLADAKMVWAYSAGNRPSPSSQ